VSRAEADFTPLMEEHFHAPRNSGKLDRPDAVGEARHGPCGDWLVLYLRIVDERIEAATFKAYGCPAAIAAGSMLTCLVTGATVDQARAIDDLAVARALGGFPERRMHCSMLAGACLADALATWERRRT